jgi:cysteine desulfurase
MSETPIYLDNHATTRTDPRVVDAMLPYFGDRYGNPSSRVHALAQDAADGLDAARASVAASLGARASEIVFTSGATESNRLAFESAAGGVDRPHVVVSAFEHKSVLDLAPPRTTRVGVGAGGVVDPDAVRRALTPATVLVSVMAANNEIGTLQPVAEIAEVCREAGVPLHCDATAAIGRVPFDVRATGADYVSFSAHKIYGPKGTGVLYARTGAGRAPSRPGTPNLPGAVGIAKALELCLAEMDAERARLLALRTRLWERIRSGLTAVTMNGDADRRLPGNLNVCFAGVDGRALLLGLRGLAVSSGSACAAATVRPSHVLKAIGRTDKESLASLRFGVGRFNTEAEIDRAAEIVVEAVRKLRGTTGFSPAPLESEPVLGKTLHADRQ